MLTCVDGSTPAGWKVGSGFGVDNVRPKATVAAVQANEEDWRVNGRFSPLQAPLATQMKARVRFVPYGPRRLDHLQPTSQYPLNAL